jgi:acyl-CoA dehydrogenase
MGWHASDTATVAMHDVFVARENLLGELHGGFALIMANFKGAAEHVAGHGRRDAVGRHQFADMATAIHTARCVTYDALRRFHAGEDAVQQVTMAKLHTQRAYMREHGIERFHRDARLGPIGGGTDEIMREILSRSMGL